tara:strand:+ start:59 stop:286 length:228 start_codon:yes stop_codon:yes gene_type:complete
MRKGLKVDAIMPWEVGFLLILTGIILIFWGIRQGKKKDIDLNNLPFTKPTTKIIFGSALILIGFVQLLPVITDLS